MIEIYIINCCKMGLYSFIDITIFNINYIVNNDEIYRITLI